MTEEWRDVVGYEGAYQVSNLGNLRSLDKKVQNGGVPSFVQHGGYCDN